MRSLNWPAQSTDLNPIEHLWYVFSRSLHDLRLPDFRGPLKVNMHRTWAAIDVQTCHEPLLSNPYQIRAVILA